MVRAIQQCLEMRVKKVLCVATAALEAQLLNNGRTEHSAFKIAIPCDDKFV